MMSTGFVIPIVGMLFMAAVFFALVVGVVVLTTVSPETRKKLLIGLGVTIPLGLVFLFSLLFVGYTTVEIQREDATSQQAQVIERHGTLAIDKGHISSVHVVDDDFNGTDAVVEIHDSELNQPAQVVEHTTVVRPTILTSFVGLAVVVIVVLGIVALVSFLNTASPRARRVFHVVAGVLVAGVCCLVLAANIFMVREDAVLEKDSSISLQTTVGVQGSGSTTSGHSAVEPSKYLRHSSDSHGSQRVASHVLGGVPMTWATVSVMVVAAIGVMLVVVFVLRKAEAFVFWNTRWRPAGAIASAVVLASVGSLFVLKAPDPSRALYVNEKPSFASFLDDRFGNGRGNSGFGDLLEMASETDLSESEARNPDLSVIGGLPYGVPSEPNNSYSPNFTFTSGRAGSPAAEGAWEPLLCRDEIYRINAADSLNRVLLESGETPVAHSEEDAIPDDAVIWIGAPEPTALTAAASGQFTTVAEAWDDLHAQLRKRVELDSPEAVAANYDQMVARGLYAAVTRLAVSRRPLVLESELEDDLVQPMYRVHVAISERDWDAATDSRSFDLDPSRRRALILVFVMAGLTILMGCTTSLATRPQSD